MKKITKMMICQTLFLIFVFLGARVFAEEQNSPAPDLMAPSAEFLMDGQYVLNAMISLTEAGINSLKVTLETLALTDNVRSGDWDKMKDILTVVEKWGLPKLLWYARPDGSYYAVDIGLTDKNLKDRDYFHNVLAGEPVAGALVKSHATGKKSVIVAVPVMSGETVQGVLGASVFLEQMSRTLKQQLGFPEDMIFFALNSQAQTTLNWREDRIFKDPTKQGSESMAYAIKDMLTKDQGEAVFDFEGLKRRVIYKKSCRLGWWFAAGTITKD